MTVTSAQVQTLLTDILGETPSTITNAFDLSSYTALANLGSTTVASLAAQIAADPEAGILQQVYRLYEAVLGRAPDAAGLQSWVAVAETGLTAAQIHAGASSVSQATWNTIINGFTASAEFQAKYSGIGGAALVDLLYSNILNRAPDATGLATWTGILGSAVAGAGPTPAAVIQVVNGIVNSQEFIKDTAANNSAATVAAALGDTGTGPTYTVTPVTPVQTISTLTTGIDNLSLTGNNNTVNGTANGGTATFNVGDQIIGAAGSTGNILNLSDLGAGPGIWNPLNLAGVTISNIQSLNFTSAEAVNVTTTGLTGVTSVGVVSVSNGASVDSVTVSDTTAVKVTDTVQANTSAQLTVTGGTTVAITEANGNFTTTGTGIIVLGGDATSSVSVTQTVGTGADQNVSITDLNTAAGGGTTGGVGTIATVAIDGLVAGNTVTINDNNLSNLSVSDVAGTTAVVTIANEATASAPATTLNLTLNNDKLVTINDNRGYYSTIAITTGATASAAKIVDVVGTGAKALTVAGSSTVTLTGSTLPNVASITVSGAAGLTDTDYNASTILKTVTDTSSGAVTLSLNDTVASFDGSKGTGKEVITITQLATTSIVGGTSGSNELVWNGAAAPGASLTGTGGTISGFTTLGIGAAVVGTQAFDLSKLTGFTSVDVQGNTTLTNLTVSKATGTSLSIDSNLNTGASTLVYSTADSAGATDTLNLALGTSGGNATVASLSVADSTGTGIGTLAVTSNGGTGGTNVLTTLVDNALSSLTVTGKSSLTISALTDNATSLTVTNNTTSTIASSITATTANLTGLTIAGSNATGTTVAVSGDTAFGTFTLTDSATGPVTASLGALINSQAVVLNDSSAGAEGVTITSANNATTLTLNDTGTGALTLAATSGNALATLAFTGTGAETISGLTSTYTATLAITDSDTGTATLTAFTANSLANLSITDSGSGNLLVAQTASTTSAANLILANTGSGTLTAGLAGTPADLTDSALTSVTGSGTGVIKTYLADTNAAAGTFDFSGSSANDVITVVHTEVAATAVTDTVKLGNGNNTVTLTDATDVTKHAVNVSFGSGANAISVYTHTNLAVDAFTQTANTGVNSATVFTAITGAIAGDTLTFAGSGTLTAGAAAVEASVAAGITAGLATASGNVFTFTLAGNSYLFLHGDASSTLSAADSLVELVGVTLTTPTVTGHGVTFA